MFHLPLPLLERANVLTCSLTQCNDHTIALHERMIYTIVGSVTALLYTIATHPLQLYMDHLVSIGQLHGLQMKDEHDFVAQAYEDDTSFLSQKQSK